MPNNPRGFTLIELLIVVVIIAILIAVGIGMFGASQTGARDSVRKSDVDSIAQALEAHFNPIAGQCNLDDGTFISASSGTYCQPQGSWFAAKKVPEDPKYTNPVGTYRYQGIPAAPVSSYILCAQLENSSGNSSDASATAQKDGQFYCRKSQQQ